jgi:hypothetical protein
VSISRRITEDREMSKNKRKQMLAITPVIRKITQPPNAKRIKPKKVIGRSTDTNRLNQKSTFIHNLLKVRGTVKILYKL